MRHRTANLRVVVASLLVPLTLCGAVAADSSITEIWIEVGAGVVESKRALAARFAAVNIDIVDMTTKGRKGLLVRIESYRTAHELRPLVEAASLLSAFLVDDRTELWRMVPEAPGGGLEHHMELVVKGHKVFHTVRSDSESKLTKYLHRLPLPERRRWLVGRLAGRTGRYQAVLVVTPPVMFGLVLDEAHVAAATVGGAPAVYGMLRKEDAVRFGDVTAVHRGNRMAITLDDVLIEVATIRDTIRDGRMLLTTRHAGVAAAETLAESLRRTGKPSGMKLVRLRLE